MNVKQEQLKDFAAVLQQLPQGDRKKIGTVITFLLWYEGKETVYITDIPDIIAGAFELFKFKVFGVA